MDKSLESISDIDPRTIEIAELHLDTLFAVIEGRPGVGGLSRPKEVIIEQLAFAIQEYAGRVTDLEHQIAWMIDENQKVQNSFNIQIKNLEYNKQYNLCDQENYKLRERIKELEIEKEWAINYIKNGKK